MSEDTNDARGSGPDWAPETLLVHGGTLRSHFGETSEALFLTQGYVYESAEQAERRFKDEEPGFLYSRFSNPTVSCSRSACGCSRARRTRAPPPPAWPPSPRPCCRYLKAGDHIVAAQGDVRLLPLHRREPVPALRHRLHAGRRRDNDAWKQGRAAQHQGLLLRDARQPDARAGRHRRRLARSRMRPAPSSSSTTCSRRRCCRSRLQLGADVVVYSATKHIDGQGRCLGGVVLCSSKFLKDHLHDFLRQTGPAHQPVQRLGDAEGPRDAAACACRRSARRRRKLADHLAGQPRHATRVLYCGRADHPAGRARPAADDRRRPDRHLRARGGKAGRVPLPQRAAASSGSPTTSATPRASITHPATTTHQRLKPEARAELGISDGMLRLSVGLEACEDLAADLDAALAAARGG